jgi:hypothetical protein
MGQELFIKLLLALVQLQLLLPEPEQNPVVESYLPTGK